MNKLEQLLSQLPDYAKDIRLNLTSLMNNHNLLSDQQFYGTLLVSGYASKNFEISSAIKEEASKYLDENMLNMAKAAATIMAMNNIYYRFTDLIEDTSYQQMPAGLRMNVMRDYANNKVDFELLSLAVSIINGCSMCISAHEKQLVQHDITKETIQLVAKIAAITHALARATEII